MFAFRLCLALGYPHPDVLLAQITARQFQEWRAFYALDPFGERRAELRNALLGSVIASQHGKAVDMERFMLFKEPHEEEAEHSAKAASMRAWFMEKVAQGKVFKPKLNWR